MASNLRGDQVLNEELFARASRNSHDAYQMLQQLCAACEPYDGEEPVMVMMARIAMRTWLPGCLHLDVRWLEQDSAVVSLSHGHDGQSEIVFESNLHSSFSKLRLIAEDPTALLPFQIVEVTTNRVSLEAHEMKRATTIPPAAFLDANAESEAGEALYIESIRPGPFDSFSDEAETLIRAPTPTLQTVMGTRWEDIVPELDTSDIEAVFEEGWEHPKR